MIEKILMHFQFYRKRVAVMDAYAVRLSEAVEALRAEQAESARLLALSASLKQELDKAEDENDRLRDRILRTRPARKFKP